MTGVCEVCTCVYIPWCKRGGQRTTFGCQFLPSAVLRQALSGSCRCASHVRLAGSQASRQFSCLGLPPQGVLGLQICAITSSNMRCQDYLASFFLLSHLIWTVSFSDWIFNVILFVVIRRYPQLLKKSRQMLRSLATSQPIQDPVNTSKHQNPVANMATCFSGFLSVLAYIWGNKCSKHSETERTRPSWVNRLTKLTHTSETKEAL